MFDLQHKEARCELEMHLDGKSLLLSSDPKCLGVTLDKLLTYRRHLKFLRKK